MGNHVRKAFCPAIIKATGEELALVELAAGTVAIFRSGAMVEGCSWPAGELVRGMGCFADLTSGSGPSCSTRRCGSGQLGKSSQ